MTKTKKKHNVANWPFYPSSYKRRYNHLQILVQASRTESYVQLLSNNTEERQ